VPASTPSSVLLHRLQADVSRAEHDNTLSPAAAGALLDVFGITLAHR
jgi:hypothetical protein